MIRALLMKAGQVLAPDAFMLVLESESANKGLHYLLSIACIVSGSRISTMNWELPLWAEKRDCKFTFIHIESFILFVAARISRLLTCNYNLSHYGRCAFSHAGPYYWNSLPYNVRNSVSITSFKRALKTFLFRYNTHTAH